SLPELHFIADYHEHPGYIEALRASVTEHWQAHGRTAHLLISFHGIPERYVQQGDRYFERCQKIGRASCRERVESAGGDGASRRRHTRCLSDWSSDVCSSDLSLPELHFIADYHEHPGYIEALRASVTEHWQAHGRTAHLLISFHGIPERYVQQGDRYFERCQ